MDSHKELPIVDCNPDYLCENPRTLTANPSQCMEPGKKGRECMEANHDVKVVALQLLEVYKPLRRKR